MSSKNSYLYDICEVCKNDKVSGCSKFSANPSKTTILRGMGVVRCINFDAKDELDDETDFTILLNK